MKQSWRADALYPLGVLGLTALVVGAMEVTGLAQNPLAPVLTFGIPALVCYHAVERPVRFGAALVAMILVGAFGFQGMRGETITEDRNFFGILRVNDDPTGEFRVLFHGSTDHGRQRISKREGCEPLQYFHRGGPVSDVMGLASSRGVEDVAVVGLGAGSLACYATPSQRWTFYEIDPDVVRIAKDPEYFTFLEHSEAESIEHVVGDARLELERIPDASLDLLIIDAFSGDAIPMHLLTREAMALYMSKIRPGGFLAMHISNRFLTLSPVIATLAEDMGGHMKVRMDLALSLEEQLDGRCATIWAVVGREEQGLEALRERAGWRTQAPLDHGSPWTDGHQNLFDAW